jgi:hypothetical protein
MWTKLSISKWLPFRLKNFLLFSTDMCQKYKLVSLLSSMCMIKIIYYWLHRNVNMTVSCLSMWHVGYQLLVHSYTNSVPLMVVTSADFLLAVRHPYISCSQVGRLMFRRQNWSTFEPLLVCPSNKRHFILVIYEGVPRSFWTGSLEWELQMVQLSATRLSCISILWVSLVNFGAITLCVASQWVFIVVSVYFIIDSIQKFSDTPLY